MVMSNLFFKVTFMYVELQQTSLFWSSSTTTVLCWLLCLSRYSWQVSKSWFLPQAGHFLLETSSVLYFPFIRAPEFIYFSILPVLQICWKFCKSMHITSGLLVRVFILFCKSKLLHLTRKLKNLLNPAASLALTAGHSLISFL